MKPLHEQLRTIEQYSYQTSLRMVEMIRMNYEKVLARKEKEFEKRLQNIEKHNRNRFRRRLTRKRY